VTPLLSAPLRQDSQGSFESIYRKHVRDVYGFSLSMLGNAQDAEDVTQTTFLNAYRALKRGERVDNLRAWLIAIAHNVCRQRFRTASRRPQEVELGSEVADAFSDDNAPSAHEIRDALKHLSFNQRTVLVLREIEGLSYEEIAGAMELSLSAVETLLFRARQALREQLEAADQDLGCDSVQRLISLQLDGKLSRQDRRLLRAHLRSCDECAAFARSQRARKRAMPGLIAVPLPAGLARALEGTFGPGVFSAKVAALAVSAALVGTGALMETGFLPVPGRDSGAPKRAAVEAADDVATSAPAAGASLSFPSDESGGAGVRPVKRSGALAKKKAGAGARASGGGGGAGDAGIAAASGGGASGSSGSLSGGGGSGGSLATGSTSITSAATGTLGQLTGGGGGGGVLAPVQGAVSGTTQTIQGAQQTIQGAQQTVQDTQQTIQGAVSNLPPLPGSPSLEPPSLPTVPLPGTVPPP
jgi:RNA polymerase sigma factor (sigma-70 family)